MTKILAHFSPCHRVPQTSGNNFYGSTKYFSNYRGNYISFFWDHRRLLKTESFEKKAKLPSKKKLWPSFSRNVEYGKCERTIYNVPKKNLTKYCANYQTVSLEPKRSIETNIPKCSVFTMTKNWPIFPRVIECDKPQGPIDKGPQVVLTITLEVISAFFWDLRGCWKHKVLKKGQSFQWRKFYGLHFLNLSNMKSVKEHFIGVHRVFSHFCATD